MTISNCERDMAIRIFYPSGNNATIHARFVKAGPWGNDVFMVVLEITELSRMAGSKIRRGEMLVVDPRCVCFDTDANRVVYNGRDNVAQFPDEFRSWMNEHPEWPDVLELPV